MSGVEDAVKTLRGAVRTAKGRAALDVVEGELQAGGDTREKAKAPAPRMPSKERVAEFLGNRGKRQG